MQLPRLYPIVDKATLDARGFRVACFAGELARAGVGMLQYRDKLGPPQEILNQAALITALFRGQDCVFFLNDRADLAALAGWQGVHVGQEDLSACAAREVLGDHGRVGVSTHTDEQVRAAETSCADYIAIGPIFATSSKADAQPAIGLAGLRRARALTGKTLVAIGGITRENVRSLVDAGADSVAVIGGLFAPGERPGKVAEEFLELLR